MMSAPVFYAITREHVDVTDTTYYVIRTAGGSQTIGSTRSYWGAVAYVRDVLRGRVAGQLPARVVTP